MSARSLRLEFSRRAQRDIESLLLFSERQWGRSQRLRYRAQIDGALSDLTRFPDLGRPRDDVMVGSRGLRVGEHVIYYQHDDQVVTVLRILHGRMNPERHLPAR